VGVCCATIGEAEAAIDAGITDILLANEFVTTSKLRRIAVLASRARVIVAVDAAEQVVGLSSAAERQGTIVDVLVDLDVGLGRCGVRDVSEACALARTVIHASGLRFSGIMGYEGRVRASVPNRSEKIHQVFRTLAEAKLGLQAAGLEVPIVSGAGTSTLLEALQDPTLTEIQAGSYALMEPDLEPLGLPFRCAVSVVGSVISRSQGCVVLDAGWRSMGCEYGPPIPLDGRARTRTLGMNTPCWNGTAICRCWEIGWLSAPAKIGRRSIFIVSFGSHAVDVPSIGCQSPLGVAGDGKIRCERLSEE
jgi:D-serine deaminase-like pyridoxal phosphate-dependent protein